MRAEYRLSRFVIASWLLSCSFGCGDDSDSRAADNAGAGDSGANLDAAAGETFSFFVTSLNAMRELSGSPNGFGGDLRFGESGEGAGLRGADKICTTIAERSMPGSGKKGWRAFLSAVSAGPGGTPVHAVDRIGEGPWYDRLGRLVGVTKADLIQVRPAKADPLIKNDLPNEFGVPNHNPDNTGEVDNHDVLTGSNNKGQLYRNDPRVTCNDWTKSEGDRDDAPRVGHSWPRSFGDLGGLSFGGDGGFPFPFPGFGARDGGSPFPGFGGGGGGGFPFPFPFPFPGGMDGGAPFPGFGFGGDGGVPFDFGSFGGGELSTEDWMSALDEAGCGPSVGIIEMGPPMETNPTVGSGGGYGGIYCFALTP